MNRKNLTAAVLAGLAGAAGIVGSAQAVNINPDGLGQVLIYPYYTTNGGNTTVLSVVNTSEDAKAIKVRFMEGQNSQEVLDFNLYMSAYEVWAAAISAAISCICLYRSRSKGLSAYVRPDCAMLRSAFTQVSQPSPDTDCEGLVFIVSFPYIAHLLDPNSVHIRHREHPTFM